MVRVLVPRQPQVAPCLGVSRKKPEKVRESDTSAMQTPRDPQIAEKSHLAPVGLIRHDQEVILQFKKYGFKIIPFSLARTLTKDCAQPVLCGNLGLV